MLFHAFTCQKTPYFTADEVYVQYSIVLFE